MTKDFKPGEKIYHKASGESAIVLHLIIKGDVLGPADRYEISRGITDRQEILHDEAHLMFERGEVPEELLNRVLLDEPGE